MAQSPTQRIGTVAETRALEHLRGAGLRLVERNWRCRFGEIDLVMRDGEDLVFVEVRRRRRLSSRHPSAAQTVGPRKQARLLRAARSYLAGVDQLPACRFDVVAIEEDRDGAEHLEWIRDAFHGT